MYHRILLYTYTCQLWRGTACEGPRTWDPAFDSCTSWESSLSAWSLEKYHGPEVGLRTLRGLTCNTQATDEAAARLGNMLVAQQTTQIQGSQ